MPPPSPFSCCSSSSSSPFLLFLLRRPMALRLYSAFVVSVVELTRELPSEENSTLLFPFHVMNESDVPLLMGPQPGQSLSNGDEDTDTASAALSTGRWRFGDIGG